MLLAIFLVHLAAMASPGPNVLLVARTAMADSRRAGLLTAAGVATASTLWAAGAAVGLAVLFAEAPFLRDALRVLGGLYLVYLGVRTFRAQPAPPDEPPARERPASARRAGQLAGADPPATAPTWRRPFLQGLLTNLSNPKAVVYYGSVFATLLPDSPAPGFRTAAVGVIAASAIAWHAALAVALSTRRAQGTYLRAARGIDRAAGTVMAAFGVGFALGAF